MTDWTRTTQCYDAWCDTRFPLPTTDEIDLFESRIEARLPEAYRDFLLRFNGGFFKDPFVSTDGSYREFAISYLHGMHATLKCAELGFGVSFFDDNHPAEILPIGATPGDDLLLMVVYPDEDYGCISLSTIQHTTHFIADGIAELFDLVQIPQAP